MNWKNLKSWAPFILTIIGICIIAWLCLYNSNLKKDYYTAMANNKAYLSQIDDDKANSVVFQATIDHLNYFNDSISRKLVETKDKLKIKDKQVKELSYLETELKKTDTIIFSDTIFRDNTISIDTTIGDKWMNTHLILKYPGIISVTPKTVSQKEVIIYSNKETVNPPKKFFLCRWFQKKHTVIKAVVNEENPYISNEINTFYQVID